ncbi:MAG: DUF302 domain-containing protein [Rhodobacteraceae bacterium]|nr:DUF302 domain-containing protein [Paracoccaceae bacterium]
MSDTFSIDVTVAGSHDDVVEKVTAALAAEGFGVLTTIDVKATLKKKIDVDFRAYSILGACNPGLAHKALTARADVGLMLPCNVTVEENGDGNCTVRFIDPMAMMTFQSLTGDEALKSIGADAGEKIARAAKALS